jgi:elongation factor Ts
VNAETDFVARNEQFQGFVETVAKIALEAGEDVEALKAAAYPGAGHTVAEELTRLIATIGENMTIRRAKVLSVGSGAVATYVHSAVKPGLGKIGVLAALEGTPSSPWAARSACMSPPPARRRWTSPRWTTPPWSASARC